MSFAIIDPATFVDVVPPQQPAANPEQTALLEWAAANPTDRPTPDRAANGRYKLPDPVTGKAKTWTRATTWASTIDDAAGLTTWRNRLLVAGILGNFDQFTDTALDDKQALSAVAGKALHLAGEKLAADVGTALHTAWEHACLGNKARPPAPYDADVKAVSDLMLAVDNIYVPGNWVERILLTPELGVAGTADNIITIDGINYIADLKTGSGADRLSYAVQLAIYAHATHMWRLDGTGYEPMPIVSQDTAYIIHMPAGTGTAQLVAVDIATGWELAQLCGHVREARKNKCLFTNVTDLTNDLAASLLEQRTKWIVDRVEALKVDTPEMRPIAGEKWRATGISPTPPWTGAEIDTLSDLLHSVEQSLPPADPCAPPTPTLDLDPAPVTELAPVADDGTLATAEDVAGLKATIAGLAEADHKLAMLTHWAKQGQAGGRRWDKTDAMTVRCWTIARAVIRFLVAVGADDARLRMALAYVLVEDLQTAWSTGAVLGSLTTDQADELATLADAYRAKDATVRAVIDAT